MTATPQSELESRLQTLADAADDGEIRTEDADAIRQFIAAYNPNDMLETPPEGEGTLKTGSCSVYASRLTEAARHTTLTDADADAVNGVLQALRDAGKSDWTLHGYSTALRKFYTHYEFGPAPGDITKIDTPNGGSFDPDDILTRDEIQEMLDAAGNPRDRAVFALLIFTGMRNQALRTLRVQDVDPQEGTWKVNDQQTDGLKGVEKYGTTRPLLGARGPVRDWLSYHPASDDPNAYLITGRPKYSKADPSNPVAGTTIRRILNRIAENTGNQDLARDPEDGGKPTHPHMMRHNFVTLCKRDYDLPDETVKYLIGHSPASKVMETTYSHLSDEDHIERAEVAAGIRDEPEEESALTPDACQVCGEPLPGSAKACAACGAVYAPDAQAVKQRADDDLWDSKSQADGDKEDAVDELRRLLDENPDLLDELSKHAG